MQKIKTLFKKLNRCTPIWCKIALSLGLFSAILYVIFILSPAFSDFYNRYPGAFLRAVFATISGIVPFSVAETLIMLLPMILVLVIIKIFRVSKGTISDMVRMLISMVSVLALFLSTFSLLFASGYRGTTLDKKLGLERTAVSPSDLYTTANYLNSMLETVLDEIDYSYKSSSAMPYTFNEMNDHLQKAYRKAAKKYDFLPSFTSTIKPIILSEPMTYTHISGVYTYFTGESNINTNFPDYTIPYTAAHELAHQRGIAREDEANFVAFLVCCESDEPYIRYSGYMNLFEYVLSALYKADKTKYKEILNETDQRVLYENYAYNEFFDKYRDNVVAYVSGTVNDNYLQSQGQSAGAKSYGMVVDLAVAYVRSISDD